LEVSRFSIVINYKKDNQESMRSSVKVSLFHVFYAIEFDFMKRFIFLAYELNTSSSYLLVKEKLPYFLE